MITWFRLRCLKDVLTPAATLGTAILVVALWGGVGGLACAAEPAAVQPGAQPAKAEPVKVVVSEDGKVTLATVGTDVAVVLTRLAEATNTPIIVDDAKGIKGTRVTVTLFDRTVEEILGIIAANYGLAYRKVGGVYMVSEGLPASPSSYLLSDIESITTQYVLADTAKSLLPTFLQSNVQVNTPANAVVLSAPPEVLAKFRKDIGQFDIPAAQIMLDVLMVEFTDTGLREFGLTADWANPRHGVTVEGPVGEITFKGVSTITKEVAAQLNALVQSGKATVRANPRIATVSGSSASVFVGVSQYLSQPVTIRGTYGYSIDAGVALRMTAWTGGEGDIIVSLNPGIDTGGGGGMGDTYGGGGGERGGVGVEVSTLTAPDPVTGLPDRTSREAGTTVRIRDGETIIMGGLLQRELRSRKTGIPFFKDLPLVGGLFTSEHTDETQTELVIFITPRVLTLTGHLPASEEEQLREKFLKEGKGSGNKGGGGK